MNILKDKFQGRKALILDQEEALQSAVLLPLMEVKGQLCVLFEVRSQELKGQPGEICFPGGHLETGEAPEKAALRETREELGVASEQIELWGPLDILITPFHYIIHPYVGHLKPDTELKPAASEVDHIFCVPLEYLQKTQPLVSTVEVTLKPNNQFPYELIKQGRQYHWKKGHYPVYFYHYQDYVIWGLTARILKHFLEILKK